MSSHVDGGEPTDLIRSVSRALRVLEVVGGAERPLPVKVVARRCGLNLSTAYHLVRTLAYESYVVRQPGGQYVIGPRVAELYHELVTSFRRPPRAGAVVRHLADVSGHTAYLARLDAGRVVITDLAEGRRSPYLEDLQVGLDTAAHATALGKALLSALPPRQRRRMLAEQGMRPFTPNTPTEPDQVEAELRAARGGAVLVEYGQYRDEVSCAGAAVPGDTDGGWWALGVSSRGLELPGSLVEQLRLAAADLAGPPR